MRPDAIEILPKVVRHYGEPFADHSAIPCFYLSRFAREHVTVALNGDGGDESFAGYQRYTSNVRLAALDRLPAPVRRAVAAAAGLLPRGGDDRSNLSRIRRHALASALDQRTRYIAQQSMFTRAQRAELYRPEHAAALDLARADEALLDPWRAASGSELLDQLLEVDVNSYLPGDLLAKIDIATMAYALEGRSPLLDHEFMELAASIPSELKARGGHRKLIFRSALRGWVPDEILDGPKQGFEIPVSRWLREDLRDYSREALLDAGSYTREAMDPGAVGRLLDDHVGGRADHGRRIWTLLMLELWHREAAAPASGDSLERPHAVLSDAAQAAA